MASGAVGQAAGHVRVLGPPGTDVSARLLRAEQGPDGCGVAGSPEGRDSTAAEPAAVRWASAASFAGRA